MADHAHHHNRPVNDELHPLVYKTMIGLTIWLVFSIWVFFGSGAYVGLILAMITLFFVVIVGIPTLIWLTWRRNVPADERRGISETLHDWASQDFTTWTGGLSGREAAMQILLPLAAVSIGMTVFGLVFYFDMASAGF
jgi:hypothetical protein